MLANRIEALPAQIAHRATANPQKVAVVDGTASLTLGDLERQSNALSTLFDGMKAVQDPCVGIFLERSTGFIVSALAVMKSGAAYVPLDPTTPPDRVADILADAGAIAIITDSLKARSLQPGPWRVVTLDTLDLPSAQALPLRDIDPQSIAYLIYTSGSTGRPKGVEITHDNLGNLSAWHLSAFHLTDADRASQIAGLGFDASAWEIWPTLAAGASLHIADEVTRRSPEMLRDWIVDQKITIGFVPTVLAEQMFRLEWPPRTRLRTLLTGGDVLQRCPPTGLPFSVINNYGPTECTVVATSGFVPPNGDAPPSIGRPAAQATVMILDASLNPVAPGEEGELCIGGPLVGRGYRNLPQLTEQRFITYSASGGNTMRIYRTGDRARLTENGEIAFLGRFDDQIKIRGYRIEPGEVVASLNRVPSVSTSIVSVYDVESEGPSLVAHIVPSNGVRLTDDDLRASLASRLPEYMIPRFFVFVPSLPLLPNGKIDRASLPAPHVVTPSVKPERENGKAVPSREVEQEVSNVVAALLGRSAIEPEDNFFMMGGHSMLGVQLVARLRDVFGVKLTLRQLFVAPTVKGLATEIARLTETG